MIEHLTHGLHIYLAQTSPITHLDTDLLSATERQKATRFMFDKDRQLYASAHVFLRQTLSQYAPVDPADWQFEANKYGKPAITNVGYQNLQFNLSHTPGLIAVAITLNRPVGVDIEQSTRHMRDLHRLSRQIFSTDEMADIFASEESNEQQRKFFTYWTLKEAYIKACGIGLSLSLKKFWFQPTTTQQWRLTCAPALQDDGKRWLCHAIQLTQNYFLAYVVEAGVEPNAIHIHLPPGMAVQ